MLALNRSISIKAAAIALLILLTSADIASAQSKSLQSVNYQDRFWGHFCYQGNLAPIDHPFSRADATFDFIPGLAGGGTVTFKSVNYPNFYLRHQDFRVVLNRYDGSDLFKNDASFVQRMGGLGVPGATYEASNFHDFFIRHRNFELHLEKNDGTPLFAHDATFNLIAPFAATSPATALGEQIAVYADCHSQHSWCIDGHLQVRTTGPCPTLPQNQTGDGECTHLVQAALAFVGATAPDFSNPTNYVWGTPIAKDSIANAMRGDIIQFEGTQFTNPNDPRNYWIAPHHTAIISAKNGNMVTLVEQHINEVRAVQTDVRDFSWPHTGTYTVYRAR